MYDDSARWQRLRAGNDSTPQQINDSPPQQINSVLDRIFKIYRFGF
jgi:hypothetical protein